MWILALCGFLLQIGLSGAQEDRVEPGHSIGKVSIKGDLIVMELDEGALGKANLFDLVDHTVRFTADGSRYRIETGALHWDSDFGPELHDAEVALHQFSFPFSGKQWNSFRVGRTGSIRFGTAEADNPDAYGRNDGGVTIGRFDPLGEAAGAVVESAPAICVFFKPRTSGPHYVKELADRVVITWDLTEPWGNIQDFTWFKTVNRFQAVLHRDGAIEMSYKELAAKDAIVGVYPLLAGAEKTLATVSAEPHPSVAANLDVRAVKLSVVDDTLLKITLETRGPLVAEGDKALDGIAYRVVFDTRKQPSAGTDAKTPLTWTIRGITWGRRPPRYIAFGPGVTRRVKVDGNTISMHGLLPAELRGIDQVAVFAEVAVPGNSEAVARIAPHAVRLSGVHNPEVHFSSLTRRDGPFSLAYESFHYMHLPRSQDLSCTIIKALGDNFDFLAYYSDFRIDNQEAGTPSDGPLGAIGGAVTGIGAEQRGLASYCSQGRFQWGFIQPVYAGAIQTQKYPPPDTPIGDSHDITFYKKQLEEISQDGKIPPYMYAMSQIGHEMGHRWAAFVSAKVGAETIPLGPVHWDMGLQARVPFPYVRPTEASIMGGGVWQDNFDGTYTQLDDNYYVPATGYSYLDLYLIGLISPAEVPDFFILRHLEPAGKDANGHRIFKAERTKVTIQNVIAAEGPRLPDVEHSQRHFNTGMVIVVQHGMKPSSELIERTEGIRDRWMKYFSIATGHRASMTANPR